MNKNIECFSCGWIGTESQLVSEPDDQEFTDYIYCPKCGSDDIADLDE